MTTVDIFFAACAIIGFGAMLCSFVQAHLWRAGSWLEDRRLTRAIEASEMRKITDRDNMGMRRLSDGFWLAYVAILLVGFMALLFWLGGYHIVWKPTPDQLYGCTVAQQAPNGECR